MEGNRTINFIDITFQWITRLAMLNFCWILFTIRGFGVLGLFPATVASLGIARKWIMGEHNLKIFVTFNKTYRKEFLLSNAVGWILTLIGWLLYLNYYLLVNANERFPIITIFAFYILIFIYVLVVMWIFPLISYYDSNIIEYFKNSIIIGISKLHITIVILYILFTIGYYSLEFPALLIFMTVSIASFFWKWFALRVFQQIDTK